MKKPRLYLETSLWNFCFADDAPEKKDVTLRFLEMVRLGKYRVYISNVVLEEIGRANEAKRLQLIEVINELQPELLELDDEVIALAERYVVEGVVPRTKFEDAMHAATASVHEMDALISWNLKHLANFRRMEMINGINLKEGYGKRLELITPMEVSDEEV
jgi:predicted nucleic acid-binding protein